MDGCKTLSTPLELGWQLNNSRQATIEEEYVEVANVSYVGGMMYLATCTEPDLATVVSEVSKLKHNPGVLFEP